MLNNIGMQLSLSISTLPIYTLNLNNKFGFSTNQSGGKKLHGLNSQANYTDRATAACRRSDCQLLRIEGATWSA
jgi:hypothetical protein